MQKKSIALSQQSKHALRYAKRALVEYADAMLKYLNNDPLPYVPEGTGTIIRFPDYSDPKPLPV